MSDMEDRLDRLERQFGIKKGEELPPEKEAQYRELIKKELKTMGEVERKELALRVKEEIGVDLFQK